MHRLAIYVYPDGEVRTTLQSNEKNGPSINSLAFFSKTQKEIEKFKKSIQKSISSQPSMSKKERGSDGIPRN